MSGSPRIIGILVMRQIIVLCRRLACRLGGYCRALRRPGGRSASAAAGRGGAARHTSRANRRLRPQPDAGQRPPGPFPGRGQDRRAVRRLHGRHRRLAGRAARIGRRAGRHSSAAAATTRRSSQPPTARSRRRPPSSTASRSAASRSTTCRRWCCPTRRWRRTCSASPSCRGSSATNMPTAAWCSSSRQSSGIPTAVFRRSALRRSGVRVLDSPALDLRT